MSTQDPWPTEIRLAKDKRSLRVQFDDGQAFSLPAEFLRVVSPSAEVQGHSPEQRKTVPGKIDVSVSAVEPVGNYAVRLVFSDGHDTGLYSWRYLRKIGAEQAELWSGYLAELDAKGLRRET
ncbi:gamma-butyrobetaine hydroxylase-like domain-containing protein [Bauldia sp.]|uniref:gamma-butyrobetaine hydroxylase-like domain-containing protein n=1 Tax=Bauldia sp. TaxID=2575872 RepID=UPI003BAC5AB3